jgi:hypothetical protein
MHGSSLAGAHPMSLPSGIWLSIPASPILTIWLFNEPWFFVEGCLWAILALARLDGRARPVVAPGRPGVFSPERGGRAQRIRGHRVRASRIADGVVTRVNSRGGWGCRDGWVSRE